MNSWNPHQEQICLNQHSVGLEITSRLLPMYKEQDTEMKQNQRWMILKQDTWLYREDTCTHQVPIWWSAQVQLSVSHHNTEISYCATPLNYHRKISTPVLLTGHNKLQNNSTFGILHSTLHIANTLRLSPVVRNSESLS